MWTKSKCQLVIGQTPHCSFWTKELLGGFICYTSLSVVWSAAMALPGTPNLRGWPTEPQARAKSVPKPRRSHSPNHPTPKSFKCWPDFGRQGSSRRDASVYLNDFLLRIAMTHFQQGVGGENHCISPGVTWRLPLQVRRHSWSQMALRMWRSSVHLTSSCLMHHT